MSNAHLVIKCSIAIQHFINNAFLFLYFFYNKIYYFCFVDFMFFTQYTTNKNNNIIFSLKKRIII